MKSLVMWLKIVTFVREIIKKIKKKKVYNRHIIYI